MAVRNCVEIGENLQKFITRLMANDDLVNLLYYTDKDPLSQPHLTDDEKKKKIYENLIRITPAVEAREDEKSVVTITVMNGKRDMNNTDFRNIKILIESLVPLSAWIIKNTNLRPFAILGEIEKSLCGKVVNGLGKIQGGDFELSHLSKEVSVYSQEFWITTYE